MSLCDSSDALGTHTRVHSIWTLSPEFCSWSSIFSPGTIWWKGANGCHKMKFKNEVWVIQLLSRCTVTLCALNHTNQPKHLAAVHLVRGSGVHVHRDESWLLSAHHSTSVNSHEKETWIEKHLLGWSLTSSLLSDPRWSHSHSQIHQHHLIRLHAQTVSTDGWWAPQSVSTSKAPHPRKVCKMPWQIVVEHMPSISWIDVKKLS